MLPELDVFGLEVKTFAVMFVLAYAASVAVATRRLRELGRPAHLGAQAALTATLAGIVGARVWFIVQDDAGFDGLLDALLGDGGLVWYGGLIAGALAVCAWALWRRIPLAVMADVAGLVLPVSLAVGRLGCFLSGDGDYGIESGLPWALSYEDGTVPTPPGVEVHPTELYEALVLGGLFALLWRRRDAHPPGTLIGIYLVAAGTERFLVEFLRRNEEVVAGLTAAQVTSVVLVAVGATLLTVLRRTGSQRAPA